MQLTKPNYPSCNPNQEKINHNYEQPTLHNFAMNCLVPGPRSIQIPTSNLLQQSFSVENSMNKVFDYSNSQKEPKKASDQFRKTVHYSQGVFCNQINFNELNRAQSCIISSKGILTDPILSPGVETSKKLISDTMSLLERNKSINCSIKEKYIFISTFLEKFPSLLQKPVKNEDLKKITQKEFTKELSQFVDVFLAKRPQNNVSDSFKTFNFDDHSVLYDISNLSQKIKKAKFIRKQHVKRQELRKIKDRKRRRQNEKKKLTKSIKEAETVKSLINDNEMKPNISSRDEKSAQKLKQKKNKSNFDYRAKNHYKDSPNLKSKDNQSISESTEDLNFEIPSKRLILYHVPESELNSTHQKPKLGILDNEDELHWGMNDWVCYLNQFVKYSSSSYSY